jgi:sugar phosphate permease
MAIPAVLLTVVASILNVGSGTIQQSFYVAYLEQIGMTGTLIGILVASPSIVAITGTLWLGGLLRWLGDIRLLNLGVFISILCTVIVPCFTSFLLLFLLGLLRGWSQGVSQPLMISIPSNSVPPGAEGASVGLRITMNRVVQTLTPPFMGAVAQAIGLENSFYVIGGSLMLLVGVSLYLARGIMPPWPSRT